MTETMEQNESIPQVVITGAPMTGKTTVVESLANHPDILVVEEAATWIMENEYPPISKDNPWTYEWLIGLVEKVIDRGFEREEQVQKEALQAGKKVIVQDRGILDPAAFLKGGLAEFDQISPVSHMKILQRYHTVINLGWLGSDVIDLSTNEVRFHDLDEAEKLVEPTRLAYEKHSNLIDVNSIAERAEDVTSVIDNILKKVN